MRALFILMKGGDLPPHSYWPLFLMSAALTFVTPAIIWGWLVALQLMTVAYVHEYGHWEGVRATGYTGRIYFRIFGAVMVPSSDTVHQQMIPPLMWRWSIGGSAISLLFGGTAAVIYELGRFQEVAGPLAAYNGMMLVVAMLPILTFDGKGVAYAIYSSADERTDRLISIVIAFMGLGVAGYFWLQKGSVVVPVLSLLFAARSWRQSNLDDPRHAHHEASYSNLQSFAAAMAWLFIFCAGLFLSVRYDADAAFSLG